MQAILRGLRSRLPHPWNSRSVEPVPYRIHVADSMLPATDARSVASYAQAGESGIEGIGEALELAGKDWKEISTALDLGCGYGRVLRYLCGMVEPARITACDLDPRAVAFCATELGARPLVSHPDLRRVPFASYDLIWSGSLLTHLPPAAADRFLAMLPDLLEPSGVAVISFHGPHSLKRLGDSYGGDHAAEAEAIRSEVDRQGTTYRPYPGKFATYDDSGYGMAWHLPDFLERRNRELNGDRLAWVGHLPGGWDDHHDLAVLRRPG